MSMEKYRVKVKFTYLDGDVQEVEFTTSNIEWAIKEYGRNREILSHKILESNKVGPKKLLLG